MFILEANAYMFITNIIGTLFGSPTFSQQLVETAILLLIDALKLLFSAISTLINDSPLSVVLIKIAKSHPDINYAIEKIGPWLEYTKVSLLSIFTNIKTLSSWSTSMLWGEGMLI